MWLYIPNSSTSSASAPADLASITQSSWQFQLLEQSAWSRGKPSRSRNWYQLWRRALWLQRLCGAMPEPSTADHGAALWMASLVASRASHTALPESVKASRTNEISGQRHDASLSSPGSGSSSSKTSAGCSLRAVGNVSGETFTDWVSRLREDCSRRQKSARRMSASVSSSLQWPTPAAGMPNDGEEPETWRARADLLKAKGMNGNGAGMPLAIAAKQWRTPRSHEVGEYQFEKGNKETPTPTLTGQANNWPTPTASDGGEKVTEASRQGRCLLREAQQWSTPSVADVQGGRKTRSGERNGEMLMNGQAEQLSSRLDPMMTTVGEAHSRPRRSLNPLFVEWLMGWPPGWTLAAWTEFACSGTELSLWKARMRSALLDLGLPQEAPPQQLALFG